MTIRTDTPVVRSRTRAAAALTALVCGIAALGGLLYGYDSGIAGGAASFVSVTWELDSLAEGGVVSAMMLGSLVGAVVSGAIADRWGRRFVLLVSGVLYGLAAVVSAFAPGIEVLLVARLVIGLAVGAVSAAVPVYLSEVAPARLRGLLVSGFQLLTTVGILAAYGVNALAAPTTDWRLALGLAAVPAILLIIGGVFVPESPRWLIARHRDDEADRVLQRLRGGDTSVELAEVHDSLIGEAGQGRWSDLFRKGARKPVIIGLLVFFFVQASGITAIISFTPQILQSSGFGDSATFLATVGLGVVNVALTVVGMLIVDRVGRRTLMLVGTAGMSLALVVLALTPLDGSQLSQVVAFACLAAFIVCFAVGPGLVSFVVSSEILPSHVRQKAFSLDIVVALIVSFVVALLFLPLLETVGATGTFWINAAFAIAFLVFSLIWIPETRGRSLEEIEAAYLGDAGHTR